MLGIVIFKEGRVRVKKKSLFLGGKY